MAEAAGVLYALETAVEGAVAFAKGIYDPTLPLNATFSPIPGLSLPRSGHSLSVVKGRAYLFGGTGSGPGLEGRDPDNDMHIIVLPSSGVTEADYQRVTARPSTSGGPVPSPRSGHSAAVLDDRIYIYGGASNEDGRVWVFDTEFNIWSCLDPDDDIDIPTPGPRQGHSSVTNENPRTVIQPTDHDTLPQQPPDPAKYVPEPPAPDSYGTVIISGGRRQDDTEADDVWIFDIRSRTWSELPRPSSSSARQSSRGKPRSRGSTTLAIVGDRLYQYNGEEGHVARLELDKDTLSQRSENRGFSTATHGEWQYTTWEGSKGPPPRSGAAFIPVTTGQGREYLLLFGGDFDGKNYSDVWTLQLKPGNMTAASVKDATRQAIKKHTAEATWAEVRYYNAEGKMVQENQQRGIGSRSQFAAARGTEVDGASVVVWGGNDPANRRVVGDGLMITVDR
ncbi:hypothetical protein B0A49_02229 [Cryomyces minteri]|uniref:Galactose oxidase n=1 Tax=Cryomyces minteri TaxID=331657 RepID=A0A4U0XNP3_9PEZI|nr:hypothetical protein B0A49_02229 [Cryomyces minteri]